MLYNERELKWKFSIGDSVLRQVVSAVNPFVAKDLLGGKDEDTEEVKENVMYENDVARSDTEGKYVGNEDRMALYKEHQEKFAKGDPAVKLIQRSKDG